MEAKREEITFPKRLHQEASQWDAEIRGDCSRWHGFREQGFEKHASGKRETGGPGVGEGKDKEKHKEARPAL